jgi:putative transposase
VPHVGNPDVAPNCPRCGKPLTYPFHDWTAVVTRCGRICYQRRKINLSQVFAGQKVGVKQTAEHIWLVSFMDYDLGYFDDETCRLEPIEDPFGPRLSPCLRRTVTHVPGMDQS